MSKKLFCGMRSDRVLHEVYGELKTLRSLILNVMATPWIDPLGPATRASGLPLAAIAAALATEGLAHDWSDSAGDYMCNLVFYRCRIARPDAPTGFIHLPYTIPMQAEAIAAGAPQPAGVPMSETDMLAAAKIVLQTVANALHG